MQKLIANLTENARLFAELESCRVGRKVFEVSRRAGEAPEVARSSTRRR